MQITVKTLDSRTKLFTIPDECTVKEFKEHIANDVSIPPHKQRLIFKGKVLHDDKKLSEYGADGCVVHLVERKPPVAGTNSQEGANGSSSGSTQGNQPHGLGPNIVMGAISMPVDVMGATQQIVQSLVSQLGVDSAQANISTASSDDGSSVNVHINLQAITQPGNDVLQRVNRARRFMRAASCSLNRIEGEGVLPMETDEVPNSRDTSQVPSSTAEEGDTATAAAASPASLAEVLEEARDSMTSMQPTLDRYISLLGSNSPESLDPSEDTLPDRIAEAFHNLSHAYHALSELTFNFRAPEPRRVSVLTSLSPHIPQLPLLSSFMGAPQMMPGQASQAPLHQQPQQQEQQQQQQQQPNQPGQTQPPQPPQGTNQNLRIHVNPQGGISFTTIISNLARPNSGAPSVTQSTSSMTSTSGSRMSASADNGGTQETFSSSFGGQRTSVGTNTNGSSTSASTQTAQPGLRTRIIIDDFIALISNVPASMAAAAAAAAGVSGQVLESSGSGIPLNQNQNQPSQSQGSGSVPVGTGPPQPQPRPTSVPVGQSHPQGGTQAGPHGGLGPTRPQPVSFGVLPGLHVGGARANHPDPSLPCQSFHFGPQVQHSADQRTAHQSTPAHPSEQSTPVNPPATEPAAARQEQQLPESDSQQTIAPAAVQALMGMFSNLQNHASGGIPTPSASVPASSSSSGVSTANLPNEATQRSVPDGPQRQGAGPVRAPDNRTSMIDFLLGVMEDSQSRDQEGPSQTLSELFQGMRNSGLNIQDTEGLVPALFQRLSAVLTIEDVMGVVLGSNAPYQQMQPALMVYMREDILHGNDATFENILRGVDELSFEIVDNIAESLQSVPVKEGIDIVASARSFLQFYIKNAADLVLNSEGNPNFAEYFRDHMRDLSAEFFTLLVFCYQDGMDGLEQLIRNKLPRSLLTADMDENHQEMFLQLFMRHVHQMYLSRAYCGPRLSRFMLHFPESPAPPVTSSSDVGSTAVKVQPAEEERETHDSDDSETFLTPPSSLVASGEAERPQADCQKGSQEADEVMVDDYAGDEWKSIMPEEWIPVITTDIVRQRRLPPQAPFSDAYINGLPPKRRKVADQRGVTSSEDCIPEVLRHAVAAAGATPITSVEDVSRATRENRALHRAYRREVQREVKARLDKDNDYRPDKFPQTRDYFDRDAQGN